MNTIKILSLPDIDFSHIYQADSYQNHFAGVENMMEITYIANGSLTYRIDNDVYFVKKGDILCSRYHKDASICAENYHCHHTVSANVSWDVSSNKQDLLLPIVTPAGYNTQNACRIIDEFIYDAPTYKQSQIKGAAKFLELLCEIDHCNRKMQSLNTPREQIYTEQAKKYIHEHLYSPIMQTEIAKHLGISTKYLCSVFKKSTGTTIMQYINKTKLENIKTLMDHMHLHLYEAAAMYGYNDPNYVSKLFKQIFGYNITDKPQVYPEAE